MIGLVLSQPMIEFSIQKKSKKSRARIGILRTPHGVVETPSFIGVATQATVKAMTSEESEASGNQMLICNTYHLHIRPGEKVVKKMGGLHEFMNWQRPLMTDSGGFQVFSLGFGKDHGVGKILKEKKTSSVSKGQQPRLLNISDKGVMFTSYVDGSKVFIGPKESMKIQEALGADIIFAFDECTSPLADYEYTKKSLERSHRWMRECLKAKKSSSALYGIVQGGKFKDLRKESAQYIASRPVAGFGIGGEFGDDKSKMTTMLRWVVDELPEEKPRHLLGIGHPEDILSIIKEGVDTFDCIAPTHYARHGIAFTSKGRVDLNKKSFLSDTGPVDSACRCTVCAQYSRSYMTHLLRAREITPLRLLTFHNLFYLNSLVAKIRDGIKRGTV